MAAATSESKTAGSSAPRADMQPWYRQFWPWFIIAIPGSTVVAGLFTLWLSMQTEDSLVTGTNGSIRFPVESPSREGRPHDSGSSAWVSIDADTGAAIVTLPVATLVDSTDTVDLNLRHATLASRDIRIELVSSIATNDGRPTYSGHFLTPPAGRYYLTLSSGDQAWASTTWQGSPGGGAATVRVDAESLSSNGVD